MLEDGSYTAPVGLSPIHNEDGNVDSSIRWTTLLVRGPVPCGMFQECSSLVVIIACSEGLLSERGLSGSLLSPQREVREFKAHTQLPAEQ